MQTDREVLEGICEILKININGIVTEYEYDELISLRTCGNKIKELPKEIGDLENLEILSLGNSKIENIPKEIGNLKNLKYLDLSDNKIEDLPKEIGNLIDLEYLDLKNNQIKKIPKELTSFFDNLKRLHLINMNDK